MTLVEFSTTRRVTVAMLMVAIVAFGYEGYTRLVVNLLPDIVYPTITVRTEYPGAAPQEIERLITVPTEARVSVVSNVVRVSSISRPGVSDVVVQFRWGTDMDRTSLELRQKLDMRSSMGRVAARPMFLRFDPRLDPIIRVALYGDLPLMDLRRLAEDYLRAELESLPGVAAVDVGGGLSEEVQVEVEITRLDYLGIPLDRVIERLAEENVNISGGILRDGDSEYLVRTLNELEGLTDIGEIPIGKIDGAPIRLADVARVSQGSRDRELVTRINGREGVELAIHKEGDANTVEVSRIVKARLAAFLEENAELQQGAGMEIVFDQAVFIQRAVDDVLETAVIGGLLAVVVLFLFLRSFQSTLIIGLSIPLSVITTFFLMFTFDISLNVMSLGGLALGIGMLVDSSIVVLESVQRYRNRGLSALDATRRGAGEVNKAVIAATMTTICVFLPIVFVEGIAGQLFRDLALTVTFSLLASLAVALLLIPMLASLSISAAGKAGGGSRSDLLLGSLQRGYPRFLRWALRHRLVVVVASLLIAALALGQASQLGVELIPQMSQGEFLIDLEWPPGTPLEVTAERVAAIDGRLAQLPAVSSVFSLVGTNGHTGGLPGVAMEHGAQLLIRLHSAAISAERETMSQARAVLIGEPELIHRFARPTYISLHTPVEIEIAGYNLPTLRLLAREVVERLGTIDGIEDIHSTATVGRPEIRISLDRQRVAEMGTTAERIGALLRTKLQGEVATRFTRRDRQVDIRVRATGEERETLEDLERMVVSPDSYPVPVPLAAVARVEVAEGPQEIRRVDQERVAVVSANLAGSDLGGAVSRIERALETLSLPESFSINVGGQYEEMVRSFDSMVFALLLAAFLVYLVMASQFESLLHPFVIMFTIPLGLAGSAVALLATDTTISVVVLIGLVMLCGIVVNNAIVLVDYVNHLRRGGMDKLAAVVRAGEVRFRPIVMTTTTTVLALLPVALGLGEGAEIRAPMAISVIGGLLFSSVLTLILIPVVYASLDRGR